ncbi:hypothetical protein MTO96_011108 [Rhipicephalus appendiculatus]
MVRWFQVVSLMLVVTSEYYGKKVGPIVTLQHGVAGDVFAANEVGVIITEFNYDGRGPDAHFWADNQNELYKTGDQLHDASGGSKVLGSFKKDTVFVELLKSITEYKSFGVFCKKFEVPLATGYPRQWFPSPQVPLVTGYPRQWFSSPQAPVANGSSRRRLPSLMVPLAKGYLPQWLPSPQFPLATGGFMTKGGFMTLATGSPRHRLPSPMVPLVTGYPRQWFSSPQAPVANGSSRRRLPSLMVPLAKGYLRQWFSSPQAPVANGSSRRRLPSLMVPLAKGYLRQWFSSPQAPVANGSSRRRLPSLMVPLAKGYPRQWFSSPQAPVANGSSRRRLPSLMVPLAKGYPRQWFSSPQAPVANGSSRRRLPSLMVPLAKGYLRQWFSSPQAPVANGSSRRRLPSLMVPLAKGYLRQWFSSPQAPVANGSSRRRLPSLMVPLAKADFKPPMEQSLGKLISKQPNTMASEVVLKTSAAATLKQFEYDGGCPNATFFVAVPSTSSTPEEMVHLSHGPNMTAPLDRIIRVDMDVSLPEGHNWNDFVSLAVYCVQKKEVLAEVAINKTVAESVPLYNPQKYIKKAEDTGKDKGSTPGPLSALSLVSSSVAALVAVAAVRHCFDNGDPVEY